MTFSLCGKTILVTGASRGVGAAIARGCAEAGARVLIHFATQRAAAEAVAAEIDAPAGDILQLDLARAGAGAALWRQALAAAGRIDGLVNNAGIFEPVSIAGEPEDWIRIWGRSLAVNLQAPADLAREAIGHFRQAAGGAIVNIASRAAHRGDDPDYLHYAAAKAGLVALTKSIARGFGGDSVLAYAIAPGWVATDMAPHTPEGVARAKAEIPLGAMAAPEEIGALTAFLLSGACPSATGATFDVNGASYVR